MRGRQLMDLTDMRLALGSNGIMKLRVEGVRKESTKRHMFHSHISASKLTLKALSALAMDGSRANKT
jgi:hypothetical protein